MSAGRFVPGRLTLARELLELSQAELAKQAGVSAAAVGQFESSVTSPSFATLETLSGALQTPLEFFFLEIAETTHEGFFRSLRRTSVAHRRRARALAHVAHDLVENTAETAAHVPSYLIDDLDVNQSTIEEVAAQVRSDWGVPAGPINNVVHLLEDHGIVVIRLPMDTSDVDAFSLPFEDRPVVVLGSDKADRGRSRFDAAHELGHLVMHRNQIWGVKEVEQQAHWFAAAFLMPATDIEDELPTTLDWRRFFALKIRWQVSLAALLKRASDLQRISSAQYMSAMKAMSARGWRRVEPVPLGAPEHPQWFGTLAATADVQEKSRMLPDHVLGPLRRATAS